MCRSVSVSTPSTPPSPGDRPLVAHGAMGVQVGNFTTQYNEFHLPPPRYCLDPIEAAPAPVDPLWLGGAPSRLLDARAAVVPFTGRARELRELAEWRDGPARFLSVRLLHGVGGQGKTRLARHFAVRSAEVGWKVLGVRPRPGPQDPAVSDPGPGVPLPGPASVGAGALLVVDYADRWPHSQLVQLFADLRDLPGTRVLLIGRSVQWWPAVRGELALMHAEADERRLGSLGETAADRQRQFEVARDRFAEMLDATAPDTSTEAARLDGSGVRRDCAAAPASLSDPDSTAYATVLTVHMVALSAVYAGRGASLPDRPEALAAYLLDREHMTWRRLFDAGPPFRTRPRELARVVFVATLTGAQAQRTGLAALKGTGLESVQELVDDHRLCYPPFDAGTVLEPLSPDRLAEDFLALSLPGHDVDGYDPDPWTPDALTDLLARDPEGRAPSYTPRSVTFLAAAALRWPHVAVLVNTVLRDDPGLAIDAGGAGLSAVADVPTLDHDVLEAVVELFPDHSDANLDAAMATAIDLRTRRRADAAPDKPSRISELIHPDLPYRLINAGRYADAVGALDRSIPWWRALARSGDARSGRDLAYALNLLGVAQLHCGRRSEAIEAGRESVEIYRRSNADADALGAALANHSNALLLSGDLRATLVAATEAVELHRSGTPQGERQGAARAGALRAQARALADTGQADAASGAVETALDLWRQLAATRPATWEPGLAATLDTAAQLWASAGRYQRALEASTESVAVHRRMAKANPSAHRPALAGALANLVRDLTAAGRDTEALDAAREAVALRRALAALDPLAHEPELATALLNLSSRLGHLHHWDEVLETEREAVAVLERLHATQPDHHASELARALTLLGKALRRGGRPADALAPIRRAVDLRRRLAASGAASHQASLAHSLSELAAVLAKIGQAGEGAKAAVEAVGIYAPLTGDGSPPHGPTIRDGDATLHRSALAGAYMTLSECLTAVGLPEEALTACERSTRLLLELSVTDRARYEPQLGAAFSNLATALRAVGRHAEAAGTAQNAVLIFRQLAAGNPRYNRRLATAHRNLAVVLSAPENLRHLGSAAAEAVKDLRTLAQADTGFAPDLVTTLTKQTVALAAAERWPEALATADEAVTLGRRLAAADPATHEPILARLLNAVASLLFFGDTATTWAAELARESLAVYRRLAERDPLTFGVEHQEAAAVISELLKNHGTTS